MERVATRLNHSNTSEIGLAEPLIAFLQANGLEEPCLSTLEVRVDMPSAVYTSLASGLALRAKFHQ